MYRDKFYNDAVFMQVKTASLKHNNTFAESDNYEWKLM